MTKFEEEFEKKIMPHKDNLDLMKVRKHFKDWQPQQALPVVPEFVGEWIEHCKGMGYGLIAALTFKLSSTMHEELSAKILKWLGNEGNDETFALAFITGKYEVEKPQQKRYEVKLLSGESMYFNPIGNPKNIKDYRFSFGNYAGWKTKFTKSELSEIKDGMFLKRIPGGTNLDDLGKDKSYYVWIDDCNYWKNPLIELVPVEDGE